MLGLRVELTVLGHELTPFHSLLTAIGLCALVCFGTCALTVLVTTRVLSASTADEFEDVEDGLATIERLEQSSAGISLPSATSTW